jgi:RNA polymerase sigma factor (sigma-70 family)
MIDDQALLTRFCATRDEGAFRVLVERHAQWVYAAAYRRCRDHHTAEEATQSVFILLVQRAHRLRSEHHLAGWLFMATQYTLQAMRRAERRRHAHEAKAASERTKAAAPAETVISDRLDAAVERLGEADRSAILLRFYQNLEIVEVARALAVSEEAARKRITRAVEKLRLKLGVGTSAAAVAAAASYGAAAAPAGLTGSICTGALANASSGAAGATAKAAWHLMQAGKIKVAAGVAVLVSAATVATTAVVARRAAPAPTAPMVETVEKAAPPPATTGTGGDPFATVPLRTGVQFPRTPAHEVRTGTVLDAGRYATLAGLSTTPVTMDLENATATDAYDAITAAVPEVMMDPAQFGAAGTPPNQPSDVTMHLKQVPLMEALLELRSLTGYAYAEFGDRWVIIDAPRESLPPGMWCTAGPFAVELARVQAAVDLANGAREREPQMSLIFQVLAEPRVNVWTRAETLVLDGCVDDRGRAVKTVGRNPLLVRGAPYNARNFYQEVEIGISLPRGERIPVLRGTAPLVLVSKQERVEGEIPAQPMVKHVGKMVVELSVPKPWGGAKPTADGMARNFEWPIVFRQGDMPAEDWEVLKKGVAKLRPKVFDEEDRRLGVMGYQDEKYASSAPILVTQEDGSIRLQYMYSLWPAQGGTKPVKRYVLELPTELRIVDVPFEFHDVPIP